MLYKQVQEKQTVVWHHSGDFSVTSETIVMNVPGERMRGW